jgi:DNA-directed RNA polymerase specialized sigma24 family protein
MSSGDPAGLGPFPTTHWSLVARAGHDGGDARREALEQLLRRYLPALRAHLVYGRHLPWDEADDLLQEFVARRILARDLLDRADQQLGKFRTYLLTAVDRFFIDQLRRQGARKRSLGREPPRELGDEAESLAAPPSADVFDVAWARGVLSQVIERMRAECQSSGRAEAWGVFEGRVLDPLLHGTEPADYEQLVAQFGLASADQAANVLVTAKRIFARLLREVVGEYALGDEAIAAEIRDLHEVLMRQRQ